MLFSLLIVSGSAIATAPSTLVSILIPVSVNAEGTILCKTKFQANRSGAHMLKPIDYGWAVICQNGTIREYPDYYFDTHLYTDIDLQYRHYYLLEERFNKEIDWDNPPLSLLRLIQRYGFNSNNAEMHAVDTIMNPKDFYSDFNLDPCTFRQRTLKGYTSLHGNSDHHIVYKIENIIFLRNFRSVTGRDTGSEFDTRFYIGPYFVNFSYIEITGFAVLQKN